MGVKLLSRYGLFLAIGMLITGSFNTLSNKLANVTEAECVDGEVRKYKHPYVQTWGMFLGEMLCLIAYSYTVWRDKKVGIYPEKKEGFSPIIFLAPTLCDMAGTSLMNVGLTLTHASVFQMLRGSVVIFTGIFSVVFLKRKLHRYHWAGMFLVLLGLGCVGVASVVQGGNDDANAPNPLLGDILVIGAQLIVAVQMVVEEKYLSKYDVPALQAVGWEGLFGFVILGILLVPMYFIPGDATGDRFENAHDAFYQIGKSWVILIATFGNIISIAFFNFFGISVTKQMSATTRMVLDSVRTFVIWGVSLAVGWQDFQYLQVIGFVVLLLGTCVYNKIIRLPGSFAPPPEDDHQKPLLTEAGGTAVNSSDGFPQAEEDAFI